jgi:hypothetical protein
MATFTAGAEPDLQKIVFARRCMQASLEMSAIAAKDERSELRRRAIAQNQYPKHLGKPGPNGDRVADPSDKGMRRGPL